MRKGRMKRKVSWLEEKRKSISGNKQYVTYASKQVTVCFELRVNCFMKSDCQLPHGTVRKYDKYAGSKLSLY
jgi:hypothetical protein